MPLSKSKQPRKQRKDYFDAPLHLRNRRMTAPLSNALREKYGIRRLPVHKDDRVIVFKNRSEDEEIKGKVIKVIPQRYSIHIEGHSKEKADGTVVSFPVHPSNVVITSLNLRDKKRREMIQRRSTTDVTEEVLTEDLIDEEEFDEALDDFDELDEMDEELLEEFEELEEDPLEEAEAIIDKKETDEKEEKEESS